MKAVLRQIINEVLADCVADGTLSSGQFPQLIIEKPAHAEHGDFASNVAMLLAKAEKKPPRVIAETLVKLLEKRSELIARIEVAGPGFINFTLKDEAWRTTILAITAAGADYGKSRVGEGKKAQVEFVSANPTGPLHVGHGRGAALGDTISRLLAATGWDVTREFYYNDAGAQIGNLALSVQARCLGIEPDDSRWPADGY